MLQMSPNTALDNPSEPVRNTNRRKGVYNLTGLRLDTPPSQLPPGVYVIDGKKVLKR